MRNGTVELSKHLGTNTVLLSDFKISFSTLNPAFKLHLYTAILILSQILMQKFLGKTPSLTNQQVQTFPKLLHSSIITYWQGHNTPF